MTAQEIVIKHDGGMVATKDWRYDAERDRYTIKPAPKALRRAGYDLGRVYIGGSPYNAYLRTDGGVDLV